MAGMHYLESGSLEETDSGAIMPMCACGKLLGAFPGVEDAVVALMYHAYEQGFLYAEERIMAEQEGTP